MSDSIKFKLSDIKPNPQNPRFIKDDKFKKLVQSIKDFPEMSEVREIVLNKDGVILGGNMRYRAMMAAGWKEAPVRVVDWSPEKQREFVIKDNVSGGEWDWELLANDYDKQELEDWGMDVDKEWKTEEAVEDEAPEVSSEPAISQLGEVYQLGRHRLMVGDSTKIEDVEKLMDGKDAVLMVTDPPYGVRLDQSWRDEALGAKAMGDGNKNIVENDDRADWYDAWVIAPVFICYVWHASSFTDLVMDSLRRAGFDVIQQIIWNKSIMVMGRNDYHFKHEPCWYGVKKGHNHNWQGDRTQTTVWDDASPNHIMSGSKEDKTDHPTQKPISLFSKPIKNNTKENDGVYDPFLGSGTALIACEQTNRICYGMEIDPKYADVIRKRYAKFTHPDTWEAEWQTLTPRI